MVSKQQHSASCEDFQEVLFIFSLLVLYSCWVATQVHRNILNFLILIFLLNIFCLWLALWFHSTSIFIQESQIEFFIMTNQGLFRWSFITFMPWIHLRKFSLAIACHQSSDNRNFYFAFEQSSPQLPQRLPLVSNLS